MNAKLFNASLLTACVVLASASLASAVGLLETTDHPTNPIYFDWQLLNTIVALFALALSQLPPITLLFRRQNLEVEVHSRILITHSIGNPIVGMLVSIRNTGGRQLRIRSLQIVLTRDQKPLAKFMAESYLETPSSTFPVLMAPFSLKPEETWSHMTHFFNLFDRATEKLCRESVSVFKEDIQKKRSANQDLKDHELVEADSKLVTPFITIFEKFYVWENGEYVAELIVDTEKKGITFHKKYRFTLFESDTADLKKYKEDYKFGLGTAYSDKNIGLFVPITKHDGE